MSEEKITLSQGILIITLFIIGSSLVLPTGLEAGNNLWMAIIAALIMALPVVAIYARVLALFPEEDFFDILTILFGKIIGRVVYSLFIWFAFHLGSLVLRNFGEYLGTVGIPNTPMIVNMSCLMFLCIWVSKEGIEVMGRWAKFSARFLLTLIILTSMFLTKQWNLDNLFPILYDGIKPVLAGTWETFAFPFAETVVFIMLMSSLRDRKDVYKTFWYGLLIGGFIIFLTSLSELLTLGIDLYSLSYFPSHSAISRLNIGDFIQRMEIVPAVALIGGGFVKISACLLAVSKGVCKIFKYEHYRFIVTPIGILMVLMAQLMYTSIMEMIGWAEDYWPIYAFPFQVIIPVIIWITAEIKHRWMK